MSAHDTAWNWRTRLKAAAWSALAGGVIGLVLAGVGLAVLVAAVAGALLMGGDAPASSRRDFGTVAAYVAAFAVAGGLLGLGAPLLRWRPVQVLAGIIVGVLIMLAVAIAHAGGPSAIDRTGIIAAVATGVIFGGVVGFIISGAGRTEEELAEVDRRVAEIDSRVASMRRIREAKRRRSEMRGIGEPPGGGDASV